MKATKQRARVFNDIQDSIDGLAEAMGGGAKGEDMSAALDALLKANQQRGAQGFKDEVRKMQAMGWSDYVSYYIVMGYLTTPATAVPQRHRFSSSCRFERGRTVCRRWRYLAPAPRLQRFESVGRRRHLP